MKDLLMNTAYFGPVSYYTALSTATRIRIEQYENFGKQSYRNRCRIMTANGPIQLSVPVAKANSKTLTKDLRIIYATPWRKLHLKGIESAYRNSPYYEYYMDDLVRLLERKEEFLLDLNNAILSYTLDALGLETRVEMTDDYVREGDVSCTDIRDCIHPKQERRRKGLEFQLPAYHQIFCDRFPFEADLSILDLLFCCGPESREKLGRMTLLPPTATV